MTLEGVSSTGNSFKMANKGNHPTSPNARERDASVLSNEQ